MIITARVVCWKHSSFKSDAMTNVWNARSCFKQILTQGSWVPFLALHTQKFSRFPTWADTSSHDCSLRSYYANAKTYSLEGLWYFLSVMSSKQSLLVLKHKRTLKWTRPKIVKMFADAAVDAWGCCGAYPLNNLLSLRFLDANGGKSERFPMRGMMWFFLFFQIMLCGETQSGAIKWPLPLIPALHCRI